jgi:hypothetical protein
LNLNLKSDSSLNKENSQKISSHCLA